MVETRPVNCAVECIQGCVLGESCPNQEFQTQAADFIETTSLDRMLEMAEAARLRKLTEPPKWVIPEDF
jgi:hypothetical protein